MSSDASEREPLERALHAWKERLAFLLEQEATAVDGGQKFALRKQVEEARGKLSELIRLQQPLSGGLPLHNLPYPPLGDLFTGRQEELDALARAGTAAITQSAAISGRGGIGKTRLAVEYAWRSGSRDRRRKPGARAS